VAGSLRAKNLEGFARLGTAVGKLAIAHRTHQYHLSGEDADARLEMAQNGADNIMCSANPGHAMALQRRLLCSQPSREPVDQSRGQPGGKCSVRPPWSSVRG
jgi:hypothetical protein